MRIEKLTLRKFCGSTSRVMAGTLAYLWLTLAPLQATPAQAQVAAPAAAATPASDAAAPAAAPATAAPAAAAPTPNKGDTSWMMTSTVLVILMTIPGLALF